MKTKKIQKAIGAAAISATALIGSASTAFAAGWGVDILGQQTDFGVSATPISASTISNWVQQFTTWILGIAIVLFVLRIVLTALNKMFFDKGENGNRGRNGNSGSILEAIPVVGAYPTNKEWKEIWIDFGKNVGIVVGAWIIVQLICGAIQFLFSSVVQG